jgi:hypothetical protein
MAKGVIVHGQKTIRRQKKKAAYTIPTIQAVIHGGAIQ